MLGSPGLVCDMCGGNNDEADEQPPAVLVVMLLSPRPLVMLLLAPASPMSSQIGSSKCTAVAEVRGNKGVCAWERVSAGVWQPLPFGESLKKSIKYYIYDL